MINKNLKEKFNKKDTLIVISSYPDKDGQPAKQNAVACYAQNLLRSYKNRNIIVLSEIKEGSTVYREGNVLVVPSWKPASPWLYLQLLKQLLVFNKPSKVHIQFEFNMLGSFVHSSLIPFFCASMKLVGKDVTIMQHQVIEDLSDLSGHLNIKKGTLKSGVLTSGLHVFYRLLGMFSDNIIVHESTLKDKLSKWVKKDKISIISHGLYLEESKDKFASRKELGLEKKDFVILLFGYITWYKGTDWAIKKVGEFAKTNPDLNIKLIVAGGTSATLNSKSHYKRFVNRVNKLAEKYGNSVTMTGFVPDEKVVDYFSAADIAILPYRTLMSASGPLSFSLRFGKPFIVSNVLSSIFDNPDFNDVLGTTGVTSDKLVFNLNDRSFESIIKDVSTNKKSLSTVQTVSNSLRNARTWDKIVEQYDGVIYQPSYEPVWGRIKGKVETFAYDYRYSRN